MDKNYIILFFLICFVPFVHSQKIKIKGNGIEIASNGSNTPSIDDLTKYINVAIGTNEIHEFSIKNEEKKDFIEILNITVDSDFFTINRNNFKLEKKQSGTFMVTFNSTSEEVINAIITIIAKKKDEIREYTFNISGSYNDPQDLMITQYYENGNDDHIEIINLTNKEIKEKNYYLVKYESRDRTDKEPKRGNQVEIKLEPNQVKIYSNFDLKGDDIVLISTTNDRSCYANRIDIIGEKPNWAGANTSLTKGACASEIPSKDFDINNWISLSTTEVDNASTLQNIDLGVHQLGSINWDGTRWTNGRLPDRTRTVIIDGEYTNDFGEIQACDLIINDELNFRKSISNGSNASSVIVYRDLNVSDTGTFKLGDKMSLYMYDDNATIIGNIKKYEKSTILNEQFDFTYWSSPVQTASVENVFSGVRSGRVYYFDQSKSSASDPDNDPDGTFWNVWVSANGEMKPGRGYASEANNDNRHTVLFDGQPNNGEIIEQVYYHDDNNDDNDFNLIGNPYPSAINIDIFFDLNKNVIDEVIYLWTHSTPVSEQTGDYSFDDYATYNRTGGVGVGNGPVPSNHVGSSQGFLVRAKAIGKVLFNNSMRLKNDNNEFFKMRNVKKDANENQKDRIWLNLSTDQGGFNQLLIGFIDGATSEFDSGYDALKNQNANKIGFYSLVEEKKLAIQGLGKFDSNRLIPLGFDTSVNNREYIISIENVEGNVKSSEIILIDHQLGISHNLKRGNYIFKQQEKGSFPNRFSLSLTPQPTNVEVDDVKDENIKIFNEGDTFTIEATNEVETIMMYDIQGRVILKNHPKHRSFRVNNSKSKRGEVLYIQMLHKDKSITRKKIYKR